jgi:hypothetical protein
MDLIALRFVVGIAVTVNFNKHGNYSDHLVTMSTNWGRQAIHGEHSPGSEVTDCFQNERLDSFIVVNSAEYCDYFSDLSLHC